MTLRRAMMSRAPSKSATSQLIHNVDASWNQPSKHIITTAVGRDVEAQRFLANMIPELLHCFGDEASKWFTGSGLLVYKDMKWNPEKGTTSSAKERDSEEMVEEDLWDLTSKWEQINVNKASTRPDEAALDALSAATPATGTTARKHLPQASLRKRNASPVTNLLHHSGTSTTCPSMKMVSKKLLLSPRHKLTNPLTSLEPNLSSARNNLTKTAERPKMAHYQPACPCPRLQRPHPELGLNLKKLKTRSQN
jgi:hypothetical protein